MAVTATPVFVQALEVGVVQIVNADGTGSKTVVTAGANGTKIVSLIGTSDDTSNRTFQVRITRAGTNYLQASFVIPTLAGTDGTTPSVDMMSATIWPGLPVDNDGQRYLFLESGDTLTVAAVVAVTAAKTVHVTAMGGHL